MLIGPLLVCLLDFLPSCAKVIVLGGVVEVFNGGGFICAGFWFLSYCTIPFLILLSKGLVVLKVAAVQLSLRNSLGKGPKWMNVYL